jgi:hypothetical protein
MHIATVHHAVGMFRVEADANARLIEHAPEMRELLCRVGSVLECYVRDVGDQDCCPELNEIEKLLERLR